MQQEVFKGKGYIVASRNDIILFSGYFENYTTFHYTNSAILEYHLFANEEEMLTFVKYKTKGKFNSNEIIIVNNTVNVDDMIDAYIKDAFTMKPDRLSIQEIFFVAMIIAGHFFYHYKYFTT